MKTVNFIEAINSGRKFRCIEKNSYEFNECFCILFIDVNELMEYLCEFNAPVLKLLVNSQFELEEKTITITESQFNSITNMIIENYPNDYVKTKRVCSYYKEELGF